MTFFNVNLNKPKVTLGTDDSQSWNTSMHIVKDPPKSISTIRPGKVDLVKIREQDDRLDESISVYPRGTNLFTPVQYNNTKGGKQAYLKNTHDVYRFELDAPKDTAPLSRTSINNIEINAPKQAPNINYKNVNIVDKNKTIKEEVLKGSNPTKKSNVSVGDFKNKIEKESLKINLNKLLYSLMSNKKSYLDFVKAHPEIVRKAMKSDESLIDINLTSTKSSSRNDTKRDESVFAKLNDDNTNIDLQAVRSLLVNNLVVDKANRDSLTDELIKIGLTTNKQQNVEKLFDLIKLEDGKIQENSNKVSIVSKKTRIKEVSGEENFDNKLIKHNENYHVLDIQANKGIQKEEAVKINNVNNTIEENNIKIEKGANISSYSEKNNFSLVKNKELDNRILKTQVNSSKSSDQKDKNIYKNSNTSVSLPDNVKPGSFLRQQQGNDSTITGKHIDIKSVFKNKEVHRNILRS
jgi:hypothetical protein